MWLQGVLYFMGFRPILREFLGGDLEYTSQVDGHLFGLNNDQRYDRSQGLEIEEAADAQPDHQHPTGHQGTPENESRRSRNGYLNWDSHIKELGKIVAGEESKFRHYYTHHEEDIHFWIPKSHFICTTTRPANQNRTNCTMRRSNFGAGRSTSLAIMLSGGHIKRLRGSMTEMKKRSSSIADYHKINQMLKEARPGRRKSPLGRKLLESEQRKHARIFVNNC